MRRFTVGPTAASASLSQGCPLDAMVLTNVSKEDAWDEERYGHARSLSCGYALVLAAADGGDDADGLAAERFARAAAYLWCMVDHAQRCAETYEVALVASNYGFAFSGGADVNIDAGSTVVLTVSNVEGFHDVAVFSTTSAEGSSQKRLIGASAAAAAPAELATVVLGPDAVRGDALRFECTVGDHAARGMRGNLTVGPPACPCFDGHRAFHSWSPERCASEVYALLGFLDRKKPNPEYAEAREYYDEALALAPENCGARSYVAELHVALKDEASARRALREACALCGPKETNVLAALADFAKAFPGTTPPCSVAEEQQEEPLWVANATVFFDGCRLSDVVTMPPANETAALARAFCDAVPTLGVCTDGLVAASVLSDDVVLFTFQGKRQTDASTHAAIASEALALAITAGALDNIVAQDCLVDLDKTFSQQQQQQQQQRRGGGLVVVAAFDADAPPQSSAPTPNPTQFGLEEEEEEEAAEDSSPPQSVVPALLLAALCSLLSSI